MGFETNSVGSLPHHFANLNYFPMGFETFFLVTLVCAYFIWTISLWDLKPRGIVVFFDMWYYLNYFPMGFETQHFYFLHFAILYLNYFPMGFETVLKKIWQHIMTYLNYFPMGFETNQKHTLPQIPLIWTISLWDLKRRKPHGRQVPTQFELFPYGIWNVRLVLLWPHKGSFELFPYGIWNHSPSESSLVTASNLNYFPMGFETKGWDRGEIGVIFELFPYGIWNAW